MTTLSTCRTTLGFGPDRVCFLTDVEGNFEYFLAFVELSEALTLVSTDGADGAVDLELRDGWLFVFGGDAVDKGGLVGGSIRVARSLVALKRKYPQRVCLLMGNRDINKMRLSSELTAAQLADGRLDRVAGPYWVPEAKRVSPLDFLNSLCAAETSGGGGGGGGSGGGGGGDGGPPREEVLKRNTLANRIRWMLKDTMGADGEFERRRAELQLLGGGGGGVGDEAVCESFVSSVRPGGFMHDLLHEGQLAAIHGGNLLVHGGVSSADGVALGRVPGREGRVVSVVEWAELLNSWYRQQLGEWTASPRWVSDDSSAVPRAVPGSRGGAALLDYCVPSGPPSVVLGRHLLKSGMPEPPPPSLVQSLAASGIHRLVVGHTPHGNCPTVIKSEAASEGGPYLEILMCDTSYSDMRTQDNRGAAVSEVQLLPDGSARVHGRLEDSSRLDYTLQGVRGRAWEGLAAHLGREEVRGGDLVGRSAPPDDADDADGASPPPFVKALLPDGPDGPAYLLCTVSGFRTDYSRVSPEDASALVGERGSARPLGVTRYDSKGDEVCVGSGGFSHTDSKADLVDRFFELVDTDSDEQLSVAELRAALEGQREVLKLLQGVGPAFATAEELLRMMDADRSGAVSRREFKTFVLRQIARSPRDSPAVPRRAITAPAATPAAAPDRRPPRPSSSSAAPPPIPSPPSSPPPPPGEGDGCPLGVSAEVAPLRSLPSLPLPGEQLDPDDTAELGALLGRAARPANLAFLSTLAAGAAPKPALPPPAAAAAPRASDASSASDADADADAVREMLSVPRRPRTVAVLGSVLAGRATEAAANGSGAGGGGSAAAREAASDALEARRLLDLAVRDRPRSLLRLLCATADAAAAREITRHGRVAPQQGGRATAGESLPAMERAVLLVHPPVMGCAAHRIAAALTGDGGRGGLASPLEGGRCYAWRVVNRYYSATLSLLVVPDTDATHAPLAAAAAEAGAVLLLFDRSAAAAAGESGWARVTGRWGSDLPGADELSEFVLLLLGDCGGAPGEAPPTPPEACFEFALEHGGEIVEIDSAAGSADMEQLAPLAAASRGATSPAGGRGGDESDGLSRVLEAVQCRRWPEEAAGAANGSAEVRPQNGSASGPADLAASGTAPSGARAVAAAAQEEMHRRAAAERLAARDEEAERHMAALVGEGEPNGGGEGGGGAASVGRLERDDEKLERLFEQMGQIRNSGASLPDDERRERAAALAQEMARMLADGEDEDEDGE